MFWRNGLFFIHCVLVSMASLDNLNRCLKAKHHKEFPGRMEGAEFNKYHCAPWASRSCCTFKSSQAIKRDGALSLYNMRWDHCERNLSNACREWFRKDTCFYECSPNFGPWIYNDKKSKITRRERILNVPLCASDCDAWFKACENELTCSDNWNNWKWTKQGNMCIKRECKTFKAHFKDSRNFCTNIFDRSFQYTVGTPGKDCLSLWPDVNVNGSNPNDNVAKVAQKKLDNEERKDPKVLGVLDKCLSSKIHKKTPGPEGAAFTHGCIPWRAQSCCTANTTRLIKEDGGISLYRMKWDHCGSLSKACREYFIKDTCFYECSPNLAPWIVKDHVSKYTRKERILKVPLCSKDCDGWFEACKDDRTCSDNWGENWNWTSKGNECTLGSCKRFKDYFEDPVIFCNKIFNNSFAYTDGILGKDCMTMWPRSNAKDLNREVAYLAAKRLLTSSAIQFDGQILLSVIMLVVALDH